METFYSILSVTLRPEIDEKLSVGIILIGKEQVLFYSSNKKLKAIKSLVSPSVFIGIKHSIKLIEKGFKTKLNKNNNPQHILELDLIDKSEVFNYNYIDYLSRYNNNIITFSKPTEIDIDYSNELFLQLFQKFVDESAFIKPEKVINQIEQFKELFFPKVSKYFNVEHELNLLKYPELLMPVKIDLLGRTEIEVLAQSIDMSKKLSSLKSSIGELLNVNIALPNSKKFIIASEPEKLLEVNHRIWNSVRNYKEFDYIDIKEAEKIEEYAKTHGVVPLFDEAE